MAKFCQVLNGIMKFDNNYTLLISFFYLSARILYLQNTVGIKNYNGQLFGIRLVRHVSFLLYFDLHPIGKVHPLECYRHFQLEKTSH